MSDTAADFLDAARQHMADRATTYDSPQGERSMGRTVAAFNAITGHALTEEQGWLFMEALKLVRSQQGDYRADNYEDAVAYASLRGEAAARERQVTDEKPSTCALCGADIANDVPHANACPLAAEARHCPGGMVRCAGCGACIEPNRMHFCKRPFES